MKRHILRTSALCVRGLILALLSVYLVTLFTQSAYAITFAKTYGGTDEDVARFVQQTSDGGYIVAGNTWSFGAGSSDIFLIKTDAYGNLQWAKTYGGTDHDFAYSVQQTSDGGYIVAGHIGVLFGDYMDILLIKTDAYGNVIWAKTYGGANYDYAYSVQQTSDGGYIVAGGTWSFGAGIFDIFLIKTDENGNIQWAKTYGGTREDYGFSVQQTSDGGYILAGHTVSFGAGNWDIFIIKTDANGNVQWAKTYGGTSDDLVRFVRQTSDGGYIMVGETYSFGEGYSDIFLIKTDANGNVQWAKTYGGTDYDLAFSVEQTSDGGYIAAGHTRYVDIISSYYVFLVKTDANGNLSWAKTYGGGISDGTFSFQRTSDNGYIVAGWTYSFGAGRSDIFLIKTDATGSLGSCSIVQNVSPTVNNALFSVIPLSPSVSSPSFTVNSVSPTVTSPTLTVSSPCPLSISEFCQPVSGLITPYKGGIKVIGSGEFEVKVYNVSGVLVKSIKGKNEVKIELSRGVYFVEVVSGNRVLREKVIIR
jgi:hypothetical protein